ncbi:MAG: hypothetical protein ACE5LD_05315, partial [Candidatus Bipolaricaulia bacterium]
EQPIWKYLVTLINSYIIDLLERYYDMNPTAQSRFFLLSERDMDVTDSEGNHWMVAFELENYTPVGGSSMWGKIWSVRERRWNYGNSS